MFFVECVFCVSKCPCDIIPSLILRNKLSVESVQSPAVSRDFFSLLLSMEICLSLQLSVEIVLVSSSVGVYDRGHVAANCHVLSLVAVPVTAARAHTHQRAPLPLLASGLWRSLYSGLYITTATFILRKNVVLLSMQTIRNPIFEGFFFFNVEILFSLISVIF